MHGGAEGQGGFTRYETLEDEKEMGTRGLAELRLSWRELSKISWICFGPGGQGAQTKPVEGREKRDIGHEIEKSTLT